jgi:hypothetical protein
MPTNFQKEETLCELWRKQLNEVNAAQESILLVPEL